MGDQSPELIERQMEETRDALTGKVALLENQVVGTLQSATQSVQETVQSVRHAVEDTVASVSGSVKSSVDCVRESLDVRKHAQKHPWAMVGCSLIAGVVTGMLVSSRRSSIARMESPASATAAPAFTPQLVHSKPGWFDEILDMAGVEVKKLAAHAVTTASATIKQAIAEQLPQVLERATTGNHDERNGLARDRYPQPAI